MSSPGCSGLPAARSLGKAGARRELRAPPRWAKLSGMASPRRANTLERLLDQRNEHPERITRIDQAIHTRFEQCHAVLVLDMCGFSRLTLRYGIIHFLAMIRRMSLVARPAIEGAGGRVVKTEADNIFAVFPDVPPALTAARRIEIALARHNAQVPADWDVHVGIGIGHGNLLMVGQHDLFGSELNLASKLGEDVARPGEVLLTKAAGARAGKWRARLRPRRVKISGMTIAFHALA
jgi:adenylate cyclase